MLDNDLMTDRHVMYFDLLGFLIYSSHIGVLVDINPWLSIYSDNRQVDSDSSAPMPRWIPTALRGRTTCLRAMWRLLWEWSLS